jgi:hypothetical protein
MSNRTSKTVRLYIYRARDTQDNPLFYVDTPPMTDQTWTANLNYNVNDSTWHAVA